jgi:hypothetical protein
MLTPRPRDEIETQYAKAGRMLLGNRRDGRTAIATQTVIAVTGAHHALAWVLGRTPWAPLSGRDLPDPGPAELFSEYARAEAVRHRGRRVLPEGMDRVYVGGIELALAWARGEADAPPPAG